MVKSLAFGKPSIPERPGLLTTGFRQWIIGLSLPASFKIPN
jgi:hypothetical protein